MKLFYFILLISVQYFPQKLIVDQSKTSLIKFAADATLGDFEGSTNSIEGFIEFNNNQLNRNARIEFKVFLDSIDTGIGLRNTHMRENYLETGKYPLAVFSGEIIKIDTISPSECGLIGEGEFLIHGVKRSKQIEVKFFNYGKLYKSTGDFVLKLSEFKINQPSFLFNTVDDNIKIHFSVYLKEI